jgi:hypothetical protein
MKSSIANSPVGTRHEELQQAWKMACLPLRDERPEVVEWYEERKIEARNSLIEFRSMHRSELPGKNYRFAASHVIATALRSLSGVGNRFAEGLDRRVVAKTSAARAH